MKYLSSLFIFAAVFTLSSCLPPFQPVTVPEHKVVHHEQPPRPQYHHEEPPPPPPEYHHDQPPRPEYQHNQPTRAEDIPRIVSGHEEQSHEPGPPR